MVGYCLDVLRTNIINISSLVDVLRSVHQKQTCSKNTPLNKENSLIF